MPNAAPPPLPDNVRAFPAERARPKGQGDLETPGELIQLPPRRGPEPPGPPEPHAAAADVPAERDVELEEVMTGTGPSVLREKPRSAPDAPHAMAGGDEPKKPVESVPPAPAERKKNKSVPWAPSKEPPSRPSGHEAPGAPPREPEGGGAPDPDEPGRLPTPVGPPRELARMPRRYRPELDLLLAAERAGQEVHLRGYILALVQIFDPMHIVPMRYSAMPHTYRALTLFATLADGSRAAILQYRSEMIAARTLLHEIMHMQDFADGLIQPSYHFDVPGDEVGAAELRAILLDPARAGARSSRELLLQSPILEVANYARDGLRSSNADAFDAFDGEAFRGESFLTQHGPFDEATRQRVIDSWRGLDDLLIEVENTQRRSLDPLLRYPNFAAFIRELCPRATALADEHRGTPLIVTDLDQVRAQSARFQAPMFVPTRRDEE